MVWSRAGWQNVRLVFRPWAGLLLVIKMMISPSIGCPGGWPGNMATAPEYFCLSCIMWTPTVTIIRRWAWLQQYFILSQVVDHCCKHCITYAIYNHLTGNEQSCEQALRVQYTVRATFFNGNNSICKTIVLGDNIIIIITAFIHCTRHLVRHFKFVLKRVKNLL